MRVSQKEIQIIKDTIYKYFSKNVSVFLFGSRVDDNKKGGDIDLYILTEREKDMTYKRLLTKAKLKELLYKPVDLIISNQNKQAIDIEALNGIKIF